MTNTDYLKLSLELHLFFDRIMKEHSFFLEASFMDKDREMKKIANNFQQSFSRILQEAVSLAEGNMSSEFLASLEIVTGNTLEAESISSNLSGIGINSTITTRELQLRSGRIDTNEQLLTSISNLNKQTLPLIQNLINFKSDILNQVLSCKMYTTNYPLLITHIMNEAKMYHNLLSKVENREPFSENYMYEQEVFWNNIMKEHAEFIRGLLDPSEKELIATAKKYVGDYEEIMASSNNNSSSFTTASLETTVDFRNFKVAGEEGILNCKIKSIIIPLLADHVVREANHFIRILRSNNFV